MDEALYWFWLADAVGSGYAWANLLLTLYPSPRRFYEYLRQGGEAPPCLTPRAMQRLAETEPADYQRRLEQCIRAGIAVLVPEDPDYPDRFRDLADCPIVLYATGSTACLNGGRYVGMVGTRRPTAYGARACHDLSLELARAGITIVSGLADGLDGQGHRASAEAGAPTVAFLGTAIDKTYPASNARLRLQIERELGGAVVSEYPPGYPGRQKGTFLARNRLIAGLSEVLCIAEARAKSGTMNTVEHAERYGRPVMAVPGSIFSPVSQGTNELLRSRRAGVLTQAGDVLSLLGMDPGDQTPAALPAPDLGALSPDARAVLAVLGPQAQTVDAIRAAAGLPVQKVLAALTELEFAGAATAAPGQLYTAGV